MRSLLWLHFNFEIILKLLVSSPSPSLFTRRSQNTNTHNDGSSSSLYNGPHYKRRWNKCQRQPTPPKANQINGGSRDTRTQRTRSSWDHRAASWDCMLTPLSSQEHTGLAESCHCPSHWVQRMGTTRLGPSPLQHGQCPRRTVIRYSPWDPDGASHFRVTPRPGLTHPQCCE